MTSIMAGRTDHDGRHPVRERAKREWRQVERVGSLALLVVLTGGRVPAEMLAAAARHQPPPEDEQ